MKMRKRKQHLKKIRPRTWVFSFWYRLDGSQWERYVETKSAIRVPKFEYPVTDPDKLRAKTIEVGDVLA